MYIGLQLYQKLFLSDLATQKLNLLLDIIIGYRLKIGTRMSRAVLFGRNIEFVCVL